MKIKQSEKFENVVGSIFAKLLETFPSPITLSAKDIGISDTHPDEVVETIGGAGVIPHRDTGPDEKFFDHCLEWLMREEYVTAIQTQFGTFNKVVLTEKGLTVLNAIPQCLNAEFND